MLQNTKDEYGTISKLLHWSIAIIIVGLITLGFCLHSIPGANRGFWIQLHKSFGLTVLLLLVLRFCWRLTQIRPSLKHLPKWQRRLARLTHYLLYIIAITMPLSGWIMSTASGHTTRWFSLFVINTPGIGHNSQIATTAWTIHHTVVWGLCALIIIHMAAALKHHFIDKDTVLRRMLPRSLCRQPPQD